MSAFPSSACNEGGELIMSAEDWAAEQRADQEYYESGAYLDDLEEEAFQGDRPCSCPRCSEEA